MRNTDAIPLIEMPQRTPHAFRRDTLERRWSRPALRAAVQSGKVKRLLPGFYAASEHVDSTLTRAHAATAWVGSGSIALGEAAASAWGLCESPRIIVATAPLTMSRATPSWLTLKRLAEHPPSALWHGCPVALPARAVVTAYGSLPRDQADEMVYRAVRRRIVTPEELSRLISSLPSVRHRRALKSTVSATAAGSESFLETVGLKAVLASQEFACFIRQHHLRTDGAHYRLDMYDPATRTAVELDGAVAHESPGQRARDVRGDARLASTSIVTLRLTYRDLTERPAWCREIVTRTLAHR